MAAKVSVATQLRDLLTKTTKEDVEEIDAEIAAAEESLGKLRATRKMLAQAIGLEEPRKPWTRKAKAEPSANGSAAAKSPASSTRDAYANPKDIDERRRKALMAIRASLNKSLSKESLSQKTGIAFQGPGNLASVLAHEWFHLSPDGHVTLTDKGDRVNL